MLAAPTDVSPQLRPARHRVRCSEKACEMWLATHGHHLNGCHADLLHHLRYDHKKLSIPVHPKLEQGRRKRSARVQGIPPKDVW